VPKGETRAPTPFIAAPTTFEIAGLQPDWRLFACSTQATATRVAQAR